MNDDTVPLKEHIESRIAALENATTIAAENMEKRLDGMNEFRAQLKDQANTFISRNEYVLTIEKLISDIKTLQLSKANLEGKASQQSVLVAYLISIIGIIIALISLLRE
jgi:hypothetical protein